MLGEVAVALSVLAPSEHSPTLPANAKTHDSLGAISFAKGGGGKTYVLLYWDSDH